MHRFFCLFLLSFYLSTGIFIKLLVSSFALKIYWFKILNFIEIMIGRHLPAGKKSGFSKSKIWALEKMHVFLTCPAGGKFYLFQEQNFIFCVLGFGIRYFPVWWNGLRSGFRFRRIQRILLQGRPGLPLYGSRASLYRLWASLYGLGVSSWNVVKQISRFIPEDECESPTEVFFFARICQARDLSKGDFSQHTSSPFSI